MHIHFLTTANATNLPAPISADDWTFLKDVADEYVLHYFAAFDELGQGIGWGDITLCTLHVIQTALADGRLANCRDENCERTGITEVAYRAIRGMVTATV